MLNLSNVQHQFPCDSSSCVFFFNLDTQNFISSKHFLKKSFKKLDLEKIDFERMAGAGINRVVN